MKKSVKLDQMKSLTQRMQLSTTTRRNDVSKENKESLKKSSDDGLHRMALSKAQKSSNFLIKLQKDKTKIAMQAKTSRGFH